MSHRLRIIVAGAIVGFLGAFTIWFAPGEPYQNFIVAAGTLKGVLTAWRVWVRGRNDGIPRKWRVAEWGRALCNSVRRDRGLCPWSDRAALECLR